MFAMNRWESKKAIEQKLLGGTTLVVDRYSYSGVAFSMAKGLEKDWCMAPEKGLIKPDLVVYLTHDVTILSKRSGWGEERHDDRSFQQEVDKAFLSLKDDQYWKVVYTDKPQLTLITELLPLLQSKIEEVKNQPLYTLW